MFFNEIPIGWFAVNGPFIYLLTRENFAPEGIIFAHKVTDQKAGIDKLE